jgi:pimeloyl-ACP methyl ester carboxylesterase
MNIIEAKIIFQPEKIKEQDMHDMRLLWYYLKPIKHLQIITNDAIVLDALYHKNPNKNKLIIHAHGNGGNLYDSIGIIDRYQDYASVLLFDYRGYGLSNGRPSEKGLHEDIISVWNYAIKKLKFNENDIILHGMSLGCSVVLWLGKYLLGKKRKLPQGIMIESGFYNLRRIACEYVHKNIKYLIPSKFNNIKYINKIKHHVPLLLVHSYEDEIVDISHAHHILKKADLNLDDFIIIKGSHNSPVIDQYAMTKIIKFINKNDI